MAAGLTVEPHENGVVLVAGELSLAEAPILERHLSDVLAAGTSPVIVDLAGVEFVDSTGLSVLVRAHQQASERGLEFGIQNPRPQAHRLLSLTGLEDRLTLPARPASKHQA